MVYLVVGGEKGGSYRVQVPINRRLRKSYREAGIFAESINV